MDSKNERPTLGWHVKAMDRLRWVNVVQRQCDQQGVIDGQVIWFPGMVYEDHAELMKDICAGTILFTHLYFLSCFSLSLIHFYRPLLPRLP